MSEDDEPKTPATYERERPTSATGLGFRVEQRSTAQDADCLIDDPALAVPYAAEIVLTPPLQGEKKHFDEFPVHLEVMLDEEELRDEDADFGFKLRFRCVIVDLRIRACRIIKGSKYERKLKPEEFSQTVERTVNINQVLEGEVGADASGWLRFLPFKGKIGGTREKGDLKTIASTIPLWMIRTITQQRWQIGDQILGDPLEADGLLKGSYLNQLGEGRDKDDTNPLCKLKPKGEPESYAVTVELRARKRDCVTLPVGDEPKDAPWIKDNKAIIERLLTLKMLEEQNHADGLKPPSGEVVLARTTMTVTRKSEA